MVFRYLKEVLVLEAELNGSIQGVSFPRYLEIGPSQFHNHMSKVRQEYWLTLSQFSLWYRLRRVLFNYFSFPPSRLAGHQMQQSTQRRAGKFRFHECNQQLPIAASARKKANRLQATVIKSFPPSYQVSIGAECRQEAEGCVINFDIEEGA
jgi:hypothetical protein